MNQTKLNPGIYVIPCTLSNGKEVVSRVVVEESGLETTITPNVELTEEECEELGGAVDEYLSSLQ